MKCYAWAHQEHICSVCGLPFRAYDQRGWILDARGLPLPPEFKNEDAISESVQNELSLDGVILLYDPDDEMGLLILSFAYEDLSDYGNKRRKTHPSSLCLGQLITRSCAIEEHEAAHEGGPCFSLHEPGGTMRTVNIHHWDFPTFDGRAYIPIYSACLVLSKRVIAGSRQKNLSNMRSLFLALCWRHAVALMSSATRGMSSYALGSSYYWYRLHWDFWEYGDYSRDQTGELPRIPTYVLPQRFWKEELMRAGTGILPWLWDIEPHKVTSKANEPCPGKENLEWNWELLVQ
ncbi:hypothetical protein F5Y19DRAFT_489970 [Xylariaceae sp. FL1651]|nr:hypothetical protein F5Y19DRAFT_489970 [Xylariaceae sp. FL1651]